MHTARCKILLWLGALALVLAFVPGARAQCGFPAKIKPAAWNPTNAAAHFVLAAEKGGDDSYGRSIVGLWHLNYTGTYDENFPPGAPATAPFPFLESFKTWHADGTEFENAFLPPSSGNICFGVWKDLGHGTVKLHHVGLMFDPASGGVSNVFTIDEIDTVAADGKTYKGTFDFKLFGPTDVYGQGSPISEVKGTTAGTRITVD